MLLREHRAPKRCSHKSREWNDQYDDVKFTLIDPYIGYMKPTRSLKGMKETDYKSCSRQWKVVKSFGSHIIKWPLPIKNIISRGMTAKVNAIYAFSTPTFWLMLVRGLSTAGYWATKVTIFSCYFFVVLQVSELTNLYFERWSLWNNRRDKNDW